MLKFRYVGLIDELQNGTPTASLLKALKSMAPTVRFLLVGHMPSLSEHLAVLIGAGKRARPSAGQRERGVH